ncbi:MAG: Hydroxymethylglutaryl-CoA synthase [Microgenomates group bacterium GW2011_GWC1_41_8]|uniref:Mevalonate kinase n=3 Tax=Candidatus Roizmaniibacteriota TaxID=1752723 RepID=A0A0G0XD79_9BACT|nr:MAG: Mevalonate kinase [Candidatus Levybacteria bacterium GW2011_GWA2_40_16]KKR72329.1 MAG: Mevalonate kinase [Candidatus Roizmanbacteria bacterium GW2011_GWB1_40_7]KKR93187.1 MAG: Mevalonate kinase [Candidatus Roizmanbacteria bacterium GW2011_GWA1_41_13]KKS22820.1 MAG: Mevalonate kinase [Candidatus Roizmanbacteria bacterium GW2011_GWC2_41_7]KKS23107.1 MAG: Hydroxymethylglutaryl-CoA synthase [Microgenomates group bacterium GW2011_GWC1_41_8]
MNKVVVSAPGKIHLMGEHAVVYGKPALIAAINKRLVATVSASEKFEIESPEEKKLIEKAVEVVCNRFKITDPKIHIKITSTIPTGRHAGSSAAVSVATVGALLYFLKKIWNPNLINELAYEVEKFQHGTPSGGDNSACTFGGFIWFRKELEFLKTIWQLPFQPSKKLAPFHLIDTGRPNENTGEMVALVRTFFNEYKDKGRMLLDQNEQATKDVTIAIKEGNEELLTDAIRRGEKTLEGLGVVSTKVLPLLEDIEKSGGAAKILGGGGKNGPVGLVLAYHRDSTKLKKIASKHDKMIYNIILGEEGVRLETGKKYGN